MSVRSDHGPTDHVIASFEVLIGQAEETIRLVKAGHQYQRNNVIDITSEALATAKQMRDSLYEGTRLLKQAMATNDR